MLTPEEELFLSTKDRALSGVRSACYNAITKGFEHSGHHYALRELDQINYLALLEILKPDDDAYMLPVTCKDLADGEWKQVGHNHKMMEAISATATTHKYDNIQKQYALIEDIEACTTVDELEAIKW